MFFGSLITNPLSVFQIQNGGYNMVDNTPKILQYQIIKNTIVF